MRKALVFLLCFNLASCDILFKMSPSKNIEVKARGQYIIPSDFGLDNIPDAKCIVSINSEKKEAIKLPEAYVSMPFLYSTNIAFFSRKGQFIVYDLLNKNITGKVELEIGVDKLRNATIELIEGVFYVFCDEGSVIALDKDLTKILWKKKLLSAKRGNVEHFQGNIIFSTADDVMYMLKMIDGSVISSTLSARRLGDNSINIDSPRVKAYRSKEGAFYIFQAFYDTVKAFKIQDGWFFAPLWSSISERSYLDATKNDIEYRDVIIAEEVLYYYSNTGQISAFNVKDGEKLWSQRIDKNYGMAISGEYLVVLSGDTLLFLDKARGRIKKKFALKALLKQYKKMRHYSWTSPISVSNIVVIGERSSGSLLLFYTDDMEAVDIIKTGGKFSLSPVQRDGFLYLFYPTKVIGKVKMNNNRRGS